MSDDRKFLDALDNDLCLYRRYLMDRNDELSRYLSDCDTFARGKLVAYRCALDMFDTYLYVPYSNDDNDFDEV